MRFWGTRGTVASPGPRTVRYGGNTPCLEVRVEGAPPLILDAGTGIRGLGAHLVQSYPDSPLHLVLTHRHSDHVLGLAHFGPLYAWRSPITVYCGDGESTSLESFVRQLLSPPLVPYIEGMTTRLTLAEWGEADPLQFGSARVQRCTARHPGDAAVLRVDDAEGPLLAYAPDNELIYADTSPSVIAWRESLARMLHKIPLLIHDATYRDEELPTHRGWGHSSSQEATRFALECEARTLVLFHHHPDRDDDSVERMVEAAREQVVHAGANMRVIAAWEGLTLGL
ncbi:MAG: MBL fold metallo-hydrolase [Gemmatimonadaceae bacterium]|nr:MBL fold metallo-hydrolase [Gemmatimonadaceae bacterium]